MKKYVLARIRPHDCLLTVETVQCSTYWANCIFIFTVNNNNNNIFIVNEILGNNSACNVYVIISWFWCLKIMEILLLVHTSCRSLTNSCSCLSPLSNTDCIYIRWLYGSDGDKPAQCMQYLDIFVNCAVTLMLHHLWLYHCFIPDTQFSWSTLLLI